MNDRLEEMQQKWNAANIADIVQLRKQNGWHIGLGAEQGQRKFKFKIFSDIPKLNFLDFFKREQNNSKNSFSI